MNPLFKSFFILLLLSGCQRAPSPPNGMEYISEGPSIMGVDSQEFADFVKDSGARQGLVYDDAIPSRRVSLKGFFIDRYEVTNREYKLFCEGTGHPVPSNWDGGLFPRGGEHLPVSGVTWFSARRYCRWAKKRLPTEEEWEKAARGFNGNRYPWGNEFNVENANIGMGRLVEVGTVRGDKSPFGVHDLAGNVMEWTDSWYASYSGSETRSDDFGEKFKVVRGGEGISAGHYSKNEMGFRSYVRLHVSPGVSGKDLGFRCAMDGGGGI